MSHVRRDAFPLISRISGTQGLKIYNEFSGNLWDQGFHARPSEGLMDSCQPTALFAQRRKCPDASEERSARQEFLSISFH